MGVVAQYNNNYNYHDFDSNEPVQGDKADAN
jgi:hypothetical protein